VNLLAEVMKEIGDESRESWDKMAKRILQRATESSINIACSSGLKHVDALLFDVGGFDGGPIRLALHHSMTTDGQDETWTVTEVSSGLSCAWGFYFAADAIKETLAKIAMNVAGEGRDAFNQRVMVQAAKSVEERGRLREKMH
jgi:hypothetical protein